MVKTSKKSSVGATREQKNSFKLAVNFTSTHFFSVLAVISVSLIFFASYMAYEKVLDVAIDQVNVEGQLLFQDKAEISALINLYVVNGFISVDLQELKSQLLDLPWVYRVSISRRLPKGLTVVIEEQQAVAYWNNDAMINLYGDVFMPTVLPDLTGLPAFSGFDHRQVLAVYEEAKESLSKDQQPIRKIVVDQRNVIQLVLSSETQLTMNVDQMQLQLQRWNRISQQGIAKQLFSIEQADLRYSNGAAISWKNDVALNNSLHGRGTTNGK